MATPDQIFQFVRESNKIEGIHRRPTLQEIEVTTDFLDLSVIELRDLENFVSIIQPGARLRAKSGMNVMVGSHIPPPGGSHIKKALETILEEAASGEVSPYITHVAYETLHPFMDGNGRSGRALWAWQMLDQGTWPELKLGFLHAWYYQTLEHSRKPRGV